MRQVQFPNIYTEWPTLKDIRESDCEYIKNYLSAISNNDLSNAYGCLTKMKNKFMQTKDWQERFDVCDEMINYLLQYQTTSPYSNYCVSSNEPNLKDGDMWFDTSIGIIPCTYLGLSTQYVKYKLHSGASRTIYVDIIKQPINTSSTISITTTTAGSASATIENNRVKIIIGYSANTSVFTIKATNSEGTVEQSIILNVEIVEADAAVIKMNLKRHQIVLDDGVRILKKNEDNSWTDLFNSDTITYYLNLNDYYVFTLDNYNQDFRILTKSSLTKIYSNNKLLTLTDVTIGTTTYKCFDPLQSNSGATINVDWLWRSSDNKTNGEIRYLSIDCNIKPYVT